MLLQPLINISAVKLDEKNNEKHTHWKGINKTISTWRRHNYQHKNSKNLQKHFPNPKNTSSVLVHINGNEINNMFIFYSDA